MIKQTEENFQEALDSLYDQAVESSAVIYKLGDREYKISVLTEDDPAEVITSENNFLVDCPFHKVLFWDYSGEVGDSALAFSQNLIEVEFSARPITPLVIGNRAFENCPALVWVKFQEGLEEIGERAFSDCPALGSAYMSRSHYDFYPDCGYGYLRLPSTLKRIKTGAFYGCLGLRRLIVPKDCVIDDEVDGWLTVGEFTGPNDQGYKVYTRIERY